MGVKITSIIRPPREHFYGKSLTFEVRHLTWILRFLRWCTGMEYNEATHSGSHFCRYFKTGSVLLMKNCQNRQTYWTKTTSTVRQFKEEGNVNGNVIKWWQPFYWSKTPVNLNAERDATSSFIFKCILISISWKQNWFSHEICLEIAFYLVVNLSVFLSGESDISQMQRISKLYMKTAFQKPERLTADG